MTAPLLKLSIPQAHHEAAYRTLIEDWQGNWEEVTPWILKEDAEDFPALVERWKGYSLGKGLVRHHVPHSTYFLCDPTDQITGVVNIRHALNDQLRQRGGHIGYGVPPSHRGKGYATEMLRLALKEARKLGIGDVLLSIYPHNIGSRKVILNNGGEAAGTGTFEGKALEYYLIR